MGRAHCKQNAAPVETNCGHVNNKEETRKQEKSPNYVSKIANDFDDLA